MYAVVGHWLVGSLPSYSKWVRFPPAAPIKGIIMSIKSTVNISRQWAIDRILEVTQLINTENYLGLEKISSESDYDIEDFILMKKLTVYNCDQLSKWTNSMLEKLLDKPFYRESKFSNYLINEEM